MIDDSAGASPLDVTDGPIEPTQIGPYRIQRKLGQGGTGVVYEAFDPRIARTVAIKVLPPGEPEFHARLLNEARAVNIVRHRGLVGVSDVGSLEDGSAFLVMDYLDGQTLRAVMASRPPQHTLLRFARQIAATLAATHRHGILHRDLKPDNVMVVDDDEVADGKRAIVFDFGLAKLAAEQQHPSTQQDLTDLRFALGTATYMAPEQAAGQRPLTDRVDVYALGVMLYEMLSGSPPFSARSYALLLDMHRYTAPLPLAKLVPDLSPHLASFILRLLAKHADDRPGMTDVVSALERALQDARSEPDEETADPQEETSSTISAPLGTAAKDTVSAPARGASDAANSKLDPLPTTRNRRRRNTEPLPQRRDSTTLPLARLLSADETLPPVQRTAVTETLQKNGFAAAAQSILAENETVPFARTDVVSEASMDDDAQGDTHPPRLRRQALTSRWAQPYSLQTLVTSGVLLFGLGFLLRACL